MKKLLLIASIFFTLQSNAQKDSIPSDSVPLVSIKQINEVLEEMKKNMTIEQLPLFSLLVTRLQGKLDEGIIEWRKRKKKN